MYEDGWIFCRLKLCDYGGCVDEREQVAACNNFLKNKNYKIKTVSGTKFDEFPATIGHLV